jgi:hypothetical protein
MLEPIPFAGFVEIDEIKMNANQLADELIEVTGELWISMQCANALRQFGLAESIINQKEIQIRALSEQVRNLQSEIYDWENTPCIHPVKELTDEEIEKVFYELDVGHNAIDFARAILRKAQEK